MITAKQWWDTYTYYCCYPSCEESYPLFEPNFENGREVEQGNYLFCGGHIQVILDKLNSGAALEDVSYSALRRMDT